MKVLLDPIYTGQLSRCSSAFKMRDLAVALAANGVFVYWVIPSWSSEEDRSAWLPKNPAIKYIEYPYLPDRMREYQLYTRELDRIHAFNGDFWDFDLVVTNRTSLVPTMRSTMIGPRQVYWGRKTKRVVTVEEMIILAFRTTVAKSDVASQELLTLGGYLASDIVYLTTDLERRLILEAARQYLSPSKVNAIRDRIRFASPVAFRDLMTKAPEHVFRRGERPFLLSYVGRTERSGGRLEEVHGVMEGHWILKGDPGIQLAVLTPSYNSPYPFPDFVKILRPDREAFWAQCRTEVDATLVLHQNAEFSLSIVEPVMLGVPAVVIDEPWSRSIFGEDYPFYVKSETQAYGMVKALYDDYARWYEVFAEWQQTHFQARFRPSGCFGASLVESIVSYAAEFDAELGSFVTKKWGESSMGEVHRLMGLLESREDFVLEDLLAKEGSSVGLSVLAQKAQANHRDQRRVVFSTGWNDIRLWLRARGWVDASPVTGHMKRA